MTALRRSLRMLPLSAPLVLLTACGGGPAPNTEQASIQEAESKASAMMTNSPHICLKEFNCVRGEFDKRVRYWDGTNAVAFPMDSTRQVVKWSVLADSVNAMNNQNSLGIRIHYGLDDTDPTKPALRWALQPMVMVNESQVFYAVSPVSDLLWVVAKDGSLNLSDTATWQDGPRAKYLDNVRLQRDETAKHVPLVPGEDPHSYTFLWEDMGQLCMSNGMPELIRINAIASPNVRRFVDNSWYEADWMHRLALTAVDQQNADVLSDDPTEGLVKRALEMANPCPPRCRRFVRHEHGQVPHSNCSCP